MKTLNIPIILVACVASVGLIEPAWLFLNNSQDTLASRFSQSFFSIFTLVPLSIMATGIAIFFLVIVKKYPEETRSRIIAFGFLVILVGLETFSLYLID